MLARASDSVRFLVDQGGPVVAILLTLSVIAVALIALKLFQYWRQRVGAHGNARRAVALWREGRFADARARLESDRSAVSASVLAAADMLARRRDKASIEATGQRIALSRLHQLQRGFRALDAISQISPLLGLFGTVLGMIEAFRQLQGAGNAVDPSMLAGGIWVALLTTAVGLAVAMPVSLFLTWLESRVNNERVAIETIVGALVSEAPVAAGVEASASLDEMPMAGEGVGA